jgi:hypothetical protein
MSWIGDVPAVECVVDGIREGDVSEVFDIMQWVPLYSADQPCL